MSDIDTNISEEKPDSVKIIYILYLVSLIFGVTAVIGVIMAYMNKKEAPDWLASHYIFLIHTFWKTALYSVIGILLSVVLVGFLVFLFVIIFWIVRCVKGLKLLSRKEAIPNPRSWLF